MTIDFAMPEPGPPPFTTIAWRLGHVIVGVLAVRNAVHFGRAPTDYQSFKYARDSCCGAGSARRQVRHVAGRTRRARSCSGPDRAAAGELVVSVGSRPVGAGRSSLRRHSFVLVDRLARCIGHHPVLRSASLPCALIQARTSDSSNSTCRPILKRAARCPAYPDPSPGTAGAILDSISVLDEQPGHAVPNPRISVSTAWRRRPDRTSHRPPHSTTCPTRQGRSATPLDSSALQISQVCGQLAAGRWPWRRVGRGSTRRGFGGSHGRRRGGRRRR